MPPVPTEHQEKRKRRQNVACDSCRLRRVKCDMLALLTPPASELGPARVVPPLHVLVRENPDVSCSNCVAKGIRCTTNQIVNPAKPNKGGKRIEEAKKMYGSDGSVLVPPTGSDRSSTSPAYSTTPLPSASLSVPRTNSGDSRDGSLPTVSASTTTPPEPVSSALDVNGAPLLPFYNASSYGSGSISEMQLPYTMVSNETSPLNLLSSLPPQLPQQSWNASQWQPAPLYPDVSSYSAAAMYGMSSGYAGEPELQETWDSLINPAQTAGPALAAGVPGGLSSTLASSSHHSTYPSNPADSSKFQALPLNHAYAIPPELASPPPLQTSLATQIGTLATTMTASGPDCAESFNDTELVNLRKRKHEDDDVIEIPRNAKDSWSLWAPEDKSLKWGRREQVGERLADRALGFELSRHLVKVYFQAVHLTLPAISPEVFYDEWQQVGERSDRMKPDQEALCAIMEAWAARFSDSPVVLGLERKNAQNAPKVILDGGTFVVSTTRRAHWGRARLPVCHALLDRARKIMDYHGILRKPTMAGIQAISLFTQLQHMADAMDVDSDCMGENRMMHAILVEQMTQQKLLWTADTNSIPVEAREAPLNARNSMPVVIDTEREKLQRRLYFTVMVADAFWASASGNEPKIPDENVAACGAWLDSVRGRSHQASLNALTHFLSLFYRCTIVGRRVARRISIPAVKPCNIDIPDFCDNIRSLSQQVLDIYEDLNSTATLDFAACRDDRMGFSPIHHLANLRQSCAFHLLVMHQLVTDLAKFRKTLRKAYIRAEIVSPDKSPGQEEVDMLEALKLEMTDSVLAMARSETHLFKAIQAIGMLQSASMMIRVFLTLAKVLAEIPTNEQGYPDDTPGGSGWTWLAKQAELSICIGCLDQLGWAWGDVSRIVDHITTCLETMEPTAEELAAYPKVAKSPEAVRVAIKRQQDIARNAMVVEAALKLWPPISIPHVVGSMAQNNSFLDRPEQAIDASGLPLNTGAGRHARLSLMSTDSSEKDKFDWLLPIPDPKGRKSGSTTPQPANTDPVATNFVFSNSRSTPSSLLSVPDFTSARNTRHSTAGSTHSNSPDANRDTRQVLTPAMAWEELDLSCPAAPNAKTSTVQHGRYEGAENALPDELENFLDGLIRSVNV